jgi:serine/threonine protein kinase
MKPLQHPNIVKLLGVVFEDFPMYIVLEMCPRGDLLSYLRRRESRKEMDADAQLSVCSQVCSGMTHLERHKIIHRDLAARNCLVADNLQIKLADFGMGREIESLYTARTGTKMPVKWSAPEALCFNAFSVKSDVWSFGIILWEIVTLGDTPYADIESADVLGKLEDGYRMPIPEKCNPLLYAIMLTTWEMKAENRPSFGKMMDLLVDIKTKEELKMFGTNKSSDWKNLLQKKLAVLNEIELAVPVCIQLSETAYSRAQSLLRFSVDESLQLDLQRLTDVLKGLVESGKPLSKFPLKPLAESYKHICTGHSACNKFIAKPVMAKVKPVIDDLKTALQFMHLGLKDL